MPIVNMSFNVRMCQILGLDPKKTKSIVIEFPPGDIAKVTVESCLDEIEAGKILTEIKQYHLTEVE